MNGEQCLYKLETEVFMNKYSKAISGLKQYMRAEKSALNNTRITFMQCIKQLCLQLPERYLYLAPTVAVFAMEPEEFLECQHWWCGNVRKIHRDVQISVHIFSIIIPISSVVCDGYSGCQLGWIEKMPRKLVIHTSGDVCGGEFGENCFRDEWVGEIGIPRSGSGLEQNGP